MVALHVTAFSGLAPRTTRRLLAPNQAQVAVNCRLTNGQIQPLRDPVLVHNPIVTGLKSIFRMLDSAQAEKWLTWAKDVDVVRGPIPADVQQRIYWTGDGEPRMSVFADATNGGGPYPSIFYVLGVFPPTTAASLVVTGGSGNQATRSYVYTFVTALGEESQPSPPVTVTGFINGSWDLSNLQAFPANTFTVTGGSWSGGIATLTVASTFGLRLGEPVNVTGVNPSGYNVTDAPITALTATQVSYALASDPGAWSSGGTIARRAPHNTTNMKRRIYRTIVAQSGATEFRFVVEVSGTTHSDTATDAVIALNEKLPSGNWEMPPVDMRGIITLSNGITAGFSKNQICLSEPLIPHAWPSEYRQTSSHAIVALGFYETTIVAGTTGMPYWIQGVEPETMGGGGSSIEVAWPCLSKRGLVSTPFGVMYPAPQGLALIGIGGPQIVTRDLYTDEEWRKVKPETFVASMRDNRYYASFDQDATFSYVLIIDKSEAASATIANYKLAELWTDKLSGRLYVVRDDKIHDFDGKDGVHSLFDWMSKEFSFPVPQAMGAVKIDADFTMTEEQIAVAQAAISVATTANQAMINAGYIGGAFGILPIGMVSIAGNLMQDVPLATYDSLLFELYVNGVLKFSKQVKSTKAFKTSLHGRKDNATVRMSGNISVTSAKVAETMRGLKQV